MASLFFVHGMWGAAWVWDRFGPFFENRGYRCIRTTLPYHLEGDAPPHARLGTLSMRAYAHELEREIRALPDLPVLIGHSMGGLLVQMLAARGLAQAAVLLTPAAPHGIPGLDLSVLRVFARIMLSRGFWRRPMRPSFPEAAYGILNCVPEERRRGIYDRFCHESGRAAAEIGLWILDTARTTQVDPLQVGCPLLVIGAVGDRMTPLTVVRRVAKRYRKVVYYELPGHGHWLIDEPGWEQIAALLAQWLRTRGFTPGEP